jgi:hypothetical protein
VELLASVAQAHERLGGPATRHILKREFEVYGKAEFERLAKLSKGHLYNLRQSPRYGLRHYEKTRPTAVQIGKRRKPAPNPQSGFLRIDTVHQGDGPAGLVRALQAAHMPADTKLLILVDQFEELFQFAQRTGDAAQEEIKEFLKLLLTAASSDDVAVYLVITMRIEWMNECAMYAGLAEAINQGIYLVPQMSRRQFQEAILGPLEAAGGSITSGLLDRMLNDLDNKSDQLPVLQHALMRLWQRNVLPKATGTAREPLDMAGYESVGTLTNCLSAHAEEVFGELLRTILRAVTPGM